MIILTRYDGTTIEASPEDAARLLEGCKPLSMLDATKHPESEHMRRAAAARGFPMSSQKPVEDDTAWWKTHREPPADWHSFDEWLAVKPELFPAYWIVPERREKWCAYIKDRWVMGAAEGTPRQIMSEETFKKRLADAMRLPEQGPY